MDLIHAFSARDRARAVSLLREIAMLTGPHFRYEEESLYPALVSIFGPEYVGQLLTAHDRAIGTAFTLKELVDKDQLTEKEVTTAVRLIRGILPHVSDCDGLSIMVERLPSESVGVILETRDRSLGAGVNLVEWAETMRNRPAVMRG